MTICDNCGNGNYNLIYNLENVTFLPGPVVECSSCGLRYRYADLTERALAEFYEKEEYGNESYLSDYGRDYMQRLPKSEIRLYTGALELVEKIYGKKGDLFEIGCASGILLDMAKKRGWCVSGVEVSPFLAETGRQNFNIDIKTGTIESAELPDKLYDVIIIWDVIEHFLSPSKIIEKSHALLKPGGLLFVFTQDNDSFLVWLGNFFNRFGINIFLYHLFDNYHLFFYNSRTLSDLLTQKHFAVESITHYPAEITKRTWSGITFDSIVRLGTKAAIIISGILRKHYRMAAIARKKNGTR